MDKVFKTRLIESLITLIIGLTAITSAVFIIFLIRDNFSTPAQESRDKRLENIENATTEIKKALTPYEIKDQYKKVIIIKNFKNTTKDQTYTDIANKSLVVQGIFNQGYLYVKYSVDKRAATSRDTVYTKLSALSNGKYNEYGGHLIINKSLETPQSSNYTELLYLLTDIKYKKDVKDSDVETVSADWLALLNSVGNHKALGFVSTVGMGEIEELAIYYQCVTNSECNIQVSN